MRKTSIPGIKGELIVTESEIMDRKTGAKTPYLSFSDGLNACGVYLNKDTKAELVKWLKPAAKAKKTEETNG